MPPDFIQGREPKVGAGDFQPVHWPADPELECCPPGHGDIYSGLAESGTLKALLGAGLRYAFVSNSDNLGALADVRVAAWLAAEQVPFALKAVRGTPADRKGGHLACYQHRLVLRETAQVPDGDASFTDVERWHWYNTNNIWIDLRALQNLQAADPAAPDLPLIVNRKTVDPRDPDSPLVIQLESAMGAAIGSIPGARAVHVPRSRFAPVKTTDDLLLVRSDAYELTSDGQIRPSFDGQEPVVTLDENYYKLLPDSSSGSPPGRRRCAAATGSTSKATSPSARTWWPWARCGWPVRVTSRTAKCSAAEMNCRSRTHPDAARPAGTMHSGGDGSIHVACDWQADPAAMYTRPASGGGLPDGTRRPCLRAGIVVAGFR